jgi:hypothetical protein
MAKRSAEHEFVVWLATTTQPIAQVLETALKRIEADLADLKARLGPAA